MAELTCIDCNSTDCAHVKAAQSVRQRRIHTRRHSARPLPLLTDNQLEILETIGDIPGISRSELAQKLRPRLNEYYSIHVMAGMVKRLIARGLVELNVIRDGGRYGVQGCYIAGIPRPIKPGYSGVAGRVYPKHLCQHCGLNPPHESAYCLQCIRELVFRGLGGSTLKALALR